MPADFCHVCIIPATYSLGQKLFSLPESNVTSFDIGSPQQAVSSISVASEKLRKQWPIPNHHTVLLAILASLLLALGFVLAAPWLHLRNIPGPLWAAYTRFWLVKVLASGESAAKFVDVNKTYGPLARIGPNHLLTDDPEFIRKILAVRSAYTRGPWFDILKLNPLAPNLVSERDKKSHDHLRLQMSAGYGGKEIQGLEGLVDERISDLIERLDRDWVSPPDKTKTCDIAKYIGYLNLDTITNLSFGKPMGFMEADDDVYGYSAHFEKKWSEVQHFSVLHELNIIMIKMLRVSWLNNLVTGLPRKTDKSGVGRILGIAKETVHKRFQSPQIFKNDMLGSFLKHGLTRSQAENEISVTLISGADSTATATRAILLAIISNPLVYANLQREIDNAISDGNISSPITDTEARQLPYLQACITEGLRKFPPITLLRERVVPPGGDVALGYHIPAGTFIGLNAWGLQLNTVFGDDADIFRPERWLITDQVKLQQMRAVQELVFGYGSTKCLGKNIAVVNMNKIFVELLRHFDLTLTNPLKPWTSICYGIFFQKNFNVRITRRI